MIFARNPREHEVLSGKCVAVIGCGSFGSAIAEMLVRAGLGQVTLIDPDTMRAENLGRHMLVQRDLGGPKAEALGARPLATNPEAGMCAVDESFRLGPTSAMQNHARPP